MKVTTYKAMIKKKIHDAVFAELQKESDTKEKTKKLKYKTFTQQSYITKLPPKLVYITFKIQCNMLNRIHDRPYLHKEITKCRLCGIGDESLHHIANCYMVNNDIQSIDDSIYTDEADMKYLEKIATCAEI